MNLFASRRHTPWRTWLATYLFVALAWPAAGPLPWLVFEAAEHAAADASRHDADRSADATHDDASSVHPDAYEAADVPGSPTHPLDHQCAQCEVLKHLARCVLPDARAPGVAPAPGQPVVPLGAHESRHAIFIATRPPIRGPPNLSV